MKMVSKTPVVFQGISVSLLGIISFNFGLDKKKVDENETGENKIGEERKKLINSLKELSKIRKSLSYFINYNNRRYDELFRLHEEGEIEKNIIADEYDIENIIANELIRNVEKRLKYSERFNTKNETIKRFSMYSPTIFEVYHELEIYITSSDFFWDFEKDERDGILKTFEAISENQLDFDLDSLEDELMVLMMNDILDFYEKFDNQYNELLQLI